MGKELIGLHCVELGFDTFLPYFLLWGLGIFVFPLVNFAMVQRDLH